jgi:transcriptional regulator with XRE-family HTH domain/tetratricopeptide (TPR) repeat protein
MPADLASWLREQRQGCGWSVPEMARRLREAAKTNGDKFVPGNKAVCTYIRRWERGQVAPSERYMLHYCVALGIPPAQFGQPAPSARAHPAVDSPPAGTPPDRNYADMVRRKDFLALTGATVASLLAPPLIHGWPDRQPGPQPQLTEVLLAQFQAQNEGFRWLDRQQGAQSLLPATTTHARNLTSLWQLTDPAHPLRPDLAKTAADACHLVAYQAFDQGRRVQAIEWYRSAAELAAQAQAQDLYVFAMCGVAYMHAANGDGELAAALLHQLTRLPLSPAAQCYTAVYQAHAHASTRGYDDAFAALDRAAALSVQARDEAPSPWLGIPDTTFVRRQRAMIASDLRSPEAPELLDALDRQTPEVFQRYRVMLLTDQALMHARLGEADQSAALLVEAARRNQRIGSAEKATRILAARRALDQYADSSAVRTLDQTLQATQAEAPFPGHPADGP